MGLAAGWGVYTHTLLRCHEVSLKDWGQEVVGLLTELNLSLRDYVSQELVEHRGEGNSPFLRQLLRGLF